MKKSITKIWTRLLLICIMMVQFIGCANNKNKTDLMKNVETQKINTTEDLLSENIIMTDFAVRLFQKSVKEGENTLISPLSVISALAMTANGADGETLEQMEKVFGMSKEELNAYLYNYTNNLPQGDKYKLNLANSIWFNQAKHFTVKL